MVSVEAFNRSLAERVRLNRAILTNPYWLLPVDDEGHEEFEPVGRGVRTSDSCARWMGFVVCKNVDGHRGVSVNGVDCSGKVVVRHKHMWCHKPTCPVCFIRGWSVREARNIEGRLEAGVKRGFGKVEHLTVSVPPEHYGLSEKVLREMSRLALAVRGVMGGCMIFHGYRRDRDRGVLVWKPHHHYLGFIRGGFDGCRHCPNVDRDKRNFCSGCKGFYGVSMAEYKKDGFIVEVFDERETVFGTCWYQLHHATVRVSFISRFHTVTWSGVCGNRKYGSAKLSSEDVCPACHDEMVRCAYVGKRFIPKDVGHVDYKAWFVDDEFDECGKPNYVEVVGGHVLDNGG